jgi:hypothetical protein
MKSIIKAVFGLDEIGERERQARVLEYKFSFSLVWISKERSKSGYAWVPLPTTFLSLRKFEREKLFCTHADPFYKKKLIFTNLRSKLSLIERIGENIIFH